MIGLWKLDFTGHVTEIYDMAPGNDTPQADLNVLGAGKNSPMTAGAFNAGLVPDPHCSNPQRDCYSTAAPLVFVFASFKVVSGSQFAVSKVPPYRVDYGNLAGGSLTHSSGWGSTIYGGSKIWFTHRNQAAVTQDNFLAELKSNNFHASFAFGPFIIGGGVGDPRTMIKGVIDKVTITEAAAAGIVVTEVAPPPTPPSSPTGLQIG